MQHSLIVVGGHASWVKQMERRIPGLTIFSDGRLPDARTIKNVNAVWFQTNALTHKEYLWVKEQAKKYRTAVCYFRTAGAESCAAQLREA